jgi:hypothetical protein
MLDEEFEDDLFAEEEDVCRSLDFSGRESIWSTDVGNLERSLEEEIEYALDVLEETEISDTLTAGLTPQQEEIEE